MEESTERDTTLRSLRNVATMRDELEKILLQGAEESSEVAAKTIFAAVKGVNGSLHSRGAQIVEFLLEVLEEHATDDSLLGIGRRIIGLVCKHVEDLKTLDVVVCVIFDRFATLQKGDVGTKEALKGPSVCLKMLEQCIKVSPHMNVETVQKVFEVCEKHIENYADSAVDSWLVINRLVEKRWIARAHRDRLMHLIEMVSPENARIAFQTARIAIEKDFMDPIKCSSHYTKGCGKLIAEGHVKLALTELLQLYDANEAHRLDVSGLKGHAVSSELVRVISGEDAEATQLALKLLCKAKVDSVIAALQKRGRTDLSDDSFAAVSEALAFQSGETNNDMLKETAIRFQELPSSSNLVRALAAWSDVSEQADLSQDILTECLSLAIKNLSDRDPILRVESLKLIGILYGDEDCINRVEGYEAPSDEEKLDRPTTVLTTCQAIEKSFSSWSTFANAQHVLLTLISFARGKTTNEEVKSSAIFLRVLSHFALGIFSVKLSPAWKFAGELWLALAKCSFSIAWKAMSLSLESSRDRLLSRRLSKGPDESYTSNKPRRRYTDDFTEHMELIKVAAKGPLSTQRPFFIKELFLRVDPRFFPRRRGDEIAEVYADTLRSIGGLKAAEDDKVLEKTVLSRLLVDLSRTSHSAQVAVVKCLCKARMPTLREHLDSLLRLIGETTFREELALLTQKVQNDPINCETPVRPGSVQDVLLRILWSKCIGKDDKIKSRRTTCMKFITSSLSWTSSIPHFVSLALEPIRNVGLEGQKGLRQNQAMKSHLSSQKPVSVHQGVLSSISDILKNFDTAIPDPTWKSLAMAVVCMVPLYVAGVNKNGNNVRTMTIRTLASMIDSRPTSSIFALPNVFEAIRKSSFDFSTPQNTVEAPAILHLTAAVARAQCTATRKLLCGEASWAASWAISVLKSPSCDLSATGLALDVAFEIYRIRDCEREIRVCPALTLTYLESLESFLMLLCSRMTEGGALERSSHLPQVLELISQECHSGDLHATCLKGFLFATLDLIACFTLDNCLTTECLRCVGHLIGCIAEKHPSELESIAHDVVPRLSVLFKTSAFSDGDARSTLCFAISQFGSRELNAVCHLLKRAGKSKAGRLGEQDEGAQVAVFSAIYKALNSAKEDNKSVRFGLGDIKDPQTGIDQKMTDRMNNPNFKDESNASFVECSNESLLPLLYVSILGVKNSAVSVRGCAGSALFAFGQFVTCTQGISILREVFKALKDAFLGATSVPERRELCKALGGLLRNVSGEYASCSKTIEALKLLSCSENEEVDFFENIVHLQSHRRSRSIRRVTSLLEDPAAATKHLSSTPSEDLLNHLAQTFIAPLAFRIAMDISERPDFFRNDDRHVQSALASRKDILACIAPLLRGTCRRLSWGNLRALTSRILTRIKAEEDQDRLSELHKMLIPVCESFPQSSDARVAHFCLSFALPKMFSYILKSAVDNRRTSKSSTRAGTSQSAFKRNSQGIQFSAPIAVAATHLCIRLPKPQDETKLIRLITLVISALRHSEPRVRGTAKNTLVSICFVAGQEHRSYLLRRIFSYVKEEYLKDNIMSFIHEVLTGMKKRKGDTGSVSGLESCVSLISNAIAEEILASMMTNTRGYENPNSMAYLTRHAGTRYVRAIGCAEHMGELINFSENVDEFMEPLIKSLSTAEGKRKNKLEKCLECFAAGIGRNSTVHPEHLLKFVYHYLVTYSSLDLKSKTKFRSHDTLQDSEDDGMDNKEVGFQERGKALSIRNGNSLVKFALLVLNTAIRKEAFNLNGVDSTKLRSMMVQLSRVLVPLLTTGCDITTLSTLRALKILVPLVGKGFSGSSSQTVVTTITAVLSRGNERQVASSSLPLKAACLRLSSTFFVKTRVVEYKPSAPALSVLIQIATDGLDNLSTEFQSASLGFIKSLIRSQVQHPQLFDTVTKMGTLAVQSHSPSFQTSCLNIIASFLSTYPLAKKRMKQQLMFFTNNLASYPHASGRLACTLALSTLITTLPPPKIAESILTFFLPLAAQSVNDDDKEVQVAAMKTITLLFDTVEDAGSAKRVLRTIESWILAFSSSLRDKGESEPELLLGAANGLICAANSSRTYVATYSSSLYNLPALFEVLKDGSHLLRNNVEIGIFHAVESLLVKQRSTDKAEESRASNRLSFIVGLQFDSLWQYLEERLSCASLEARASASRMLEMYLETVDTHLQGKGSPTEGLSFGTLPCREFLETLCTSIENSNLNQTIAESNSKNLLMCVKFMCKRAKSSLEAIFKDARLKNEADGLSRDLGHRWGYEVWWVLRRLSGIASRANRSKAHGMSRGAANDQASAVMGGGSALKVLIASFAVIKDHISECPRVFAAPVVRLGTGDGILAELANELGLELEKAFADGYWSVFQDLREGEERFKEERRRKRKLERISEPERSRITSAAKRRKKEASSKAKRTSRFHTATKFR